MWGEWMPADSGAGRPPAVSAVAPYHRVMASARRSGAVITLAVAALLLTGCTPGPPPGGTPSADPTSSAPSAAPTPSVSPTPGPGAEPTPGESPRALAIPACEDLIPLGIVQAYFPNAVPIESGVDPADLVAGPAAAAALRSAAQAEVCTWGIPASDGGFNVIVAELAESARDALIAELRGAGTFAEGSVGGGTSFSREIETELGLTAVTYVFDERTWVTVDGTLELDSSRQLAAAALEGVRAAND